MKMKKLTKEQLQNLRSKISIIRGIYKAFSERLSQSKEITAGDLRRYNNCLNKIIEITGDNEFINFSVSIKTAWDNETIVDGIDFNSKVNQFFEYLNTVYDLDKEKNWVYYTNPFWLFWRLLTFVWKHKIISFIIAFIGLLTADYSMGWKNIKAIFNLIKSLF